MTPSLLSNRCQRRAYIEWYRGYECRAHFWLCEAEDERREIISRAKRLNAARIFGGEFVHLSAASPTSRIPVRYLKAACDSMRITPNENGLYDCQDVLRVVRAVEKYQKRRAA